MLSIRNTETGEEIGLVDKLEYVRYLKDYHIIRPTPDVSLANGIVYEGTAYNINSDMDIPNAPLVKFVEVDTGKYVQDHAKTILENVNDISVLQQLILAQDNYISTLEEALMDLDNAMAE